MHRIDSPGAAPGNLFTDGNQIAGIPATRVIATWLNAVQEEICKVITDQGIALNKPDNTQLSDAIIKAMRRASPVGQVVTGYWATAPAGTLALTGGAVSRTTYAALWTHAQAAGLVVSEAVWTGGEKGMFSSADGSTTFRLPDLRGEFLRVLQPPRQLGTLEADEIRSHTHTIKEGQATGTGGQLTSGDDYTNIVQFTQISGATGGGETRPRNVALLAAIYY